MSEGVYNVDPSRIERSVHPSSQRPGSIEEQRRAYRPGSNMTFEQLKDVARIEQDGKFAGGSKRDHRFRCTYQTATPSWWPSGALIIFTWQSSTASGLSSISSGKVRQRKTCRTKNGFWFLVLFFGSSLERADALNLRTRNQKPETRNQNQNQKPEPETRNQNQKPETRNGCLDGSFFKPSVRRADAREEPGLYVDRGRHARVGHRLEYRDIQRRQCRVVRPLPYAEADRLSGSVSGRTDSPRGVVSYPTFWTGAPAINLLKQCRRFAAGR